MRRIIPCILALIAVLNLVWLFGFDYKIPSFLTRTAEREAGGIVEEEPAAKEEEAGAPEPEEEAVVPEPKEEVKEEEKKAESQAAEESAKEEAEEEPAPEAEETADQAEERTCRPLEGNTPNIRSGPGQDYEIIGMAESGQVMTVRGEEEEGWLPIRTGDGLEGYVFAGLVAIDEEEE